MNSSASLIFRFVQNVEPKQPPRQVRADPPRPLDQPRLEDDEDEQDVQRFLQVLRNPRVQQLLRQILVGERQVVFPLLSTSAFLAEACIRLFSGMGLWSVPNVRVGDVVLREALQDLLSQHYVRPWFSSQDKAKLQTEAGRVEIATLIVQSFADQERAPFPSEGKKRTAVEWAGFSRKVRQLPAFRAAASRDLAFSDWYLNRINEGEDRATIDAEAQEAGRHVDVEAQVSNTAWLEFFNRLHSIAPEFDSEQARERLQEAYSSGDDSTSFLTQLESLRATKEYKKQAQVLAPAVIDLVSEHEDQ